MNSLRSDWEKGALQLCDIEFVSRGRSGNPRYLRRRLGSTQYVVGV